MIRKTPLTEEEKQDLHAVKMLFAQTKDSEHLEDGKMLEGLSPEQARAMILLYRTSLEDPPLFFLGYKLFTWISPILTAWAHIKDIFLSA